MSVGFDHVDVEALNKRKIPLGYTPDVLTDATADLTVLLTLAAARRMKEGMNAASQGEVSTKNVHYFHPFFIIKPKLFIFTSFLYSGEHGDLLGYVEHSSRVKH